MSNLPLREEIDEIYKLKLKDIYENEELWEQDYSEVKSKLLI